MANHYTNICFGIVLPRSDAERALDIWTKIADISDRAYDHPETLTSDEKELIDRIGEHIGLMCKIEPIWVRPGEDKTLHDTHASLVLSTDESASVDWACEFVHQLFDANILMDPFGFEWANDCSRQLTEVYGGGAVLIGPGRREEFVNTRQWIDAKKKEWEAA